MKRIIAILFLVSVSSSFAAEESAEDIAKRVIADPTSAYTPGEQPIISYVPPPPVRAPEEIQLADAATKAQGALLSYMLSDAVPEKTRIAYAITVLARKRALTELVKDNIFGSVDARKNEGYLKDGLMLAARLAKIEEVEQGGARQPATAVDSETEGNEKPRSEPDLRYQHMKTSPDTVEKHLSGDVAAFRKALKSVADPRSLGHRFRIVHTLHGDYLGPAGEIGGEPSSVMCWFFSSEGAIYRVHFDGKVIQLEKPPGWLHPGIRSPDWIDPPFRLVDETEAGEQGDAVQPATAADSKAEGTEKPSTESEGRSQ